MDLRKALRLPAVDACGYGAGQRDERDGVRQHHELVEHIGKLPDQIVREQRSQEDEGERYDEERHDAFLAEQVFDVQAGEQVPAQDRREREEQQADGDECVSEAGAEEFAECVLGHVGLIDAGGSGVGFGFLGGIIGGFLAGYTILLLEKVFAKLPENLNGLKAMFLYPLCSAFIVGLIMLGISGPMASINIAMMNFLKGLSASGPIVLGLAIGCMCAFDMGGPVNKAAYVTGTAMLTEALAAGVGTSTYNFGTNFMAAVSAACIVPPLITTFAVLFGKKYFTQEDHDAGLVNFILGCTHITEGAIPFMTKNIWPVMPIMMLGSSIGAILTIFFGVHDPAPHGGFLVLPVVDGGLMWVVAILIGTIVGGLLFLLFKRGQYVKNGNKVIE